MQEEKRKTEAPGQRIPDSRVAPITPKGRWEGEKNFDRRQDKRGTERSEKPRKTGLTFLKKYQ